ncbi:IclR family transcriptional regulator [Halobellus salinisoli]|uniref:IclR family transcriptional regulator n=1 Tax=Halobellus salinisoli TaxID=3108500 RepID=UPI003009024F
MSGKTIKSSVTTMRVINGLKELGGAKVTQLADYLDLTKPTVHHHLSTLVQEEYVVKEADTYYIGLRFLELGELARDRFKIHKVAKPEVEKLAEQTGELANVAVLEYGRVVYLYRARGSEAVNLDTYSGKRVQIHCTALGKAMLANLPQEQVDEILAENEFQAETDATITKRDEFLAELEEVRQQGVAFDREEAFSGLHCVAAPILDADGRAMGAISVSGPTSRLRGNQFSEDLPDMVTRAGNVIELNITYS